MSVTLTIPPPRFVFMEVNKRCNLKCTHCDFWQRDDDDRANYLSLEQKRSILEEFAEINPEGNLVICGGEPMLDLEEYFGLAAAARQNGIRVLSVVNGTRIRRAEMAERMVREGPNEISISLNSHIPALHDETRGVPGAFEKATEAIRLLVDAKRRLGAEDTRIYVMGLIFGRNYREIDGFYDFVLNDLGADQLKLNFIQPSFGQAGEIDPFFEAESDVDGDEIVDIISRCNEKYGLGLNPIWIGQVGMYFRSLAKINKDDRKRGWGASKGTDEHICNTYNRNIMINHYGVARLCFSVGFPGKVLEKRGDLTSFWAGANGIRARMRKCNQFCGISHSVRRESSTEKGRDKMVAHEARFGVVPPPGPVTELMEGIRAFIR
ncbi:MAG: radical SAM protein [Alphaproteobacteria bacterium]